MSDPIAPNFINGVGRLATDRYAFEKHINGTDDRHKANQIDLFPTVVIGTTKSNVQDAITAIAAVIGTPPPDASTTVKGIVKLAGDISGTATNVVVTRLQGKPVSTLTPITGDVLTWDGSTWKPQSISGIFSNLNVTGNTTLGTNSGNTLLVNSQATFTNNLSVNGNTNLGNSSGNITTIQGRLIGPGIDFTSSGASMAGTDLFMTYTDEIDLSANTRIALASPQINLNSSSTISLTSTSSTTINTGSGQQLFLNTNVQLNGPYAFTFTGTSLVYVTSGCTFSMNASLIMGGYGKISKKYTTGPDSNSDIFPAQYDVFLEDSITGDRQWTINEAFGATLAGIDFEVINNSAHTITVYDPTLSTLVSVGPSQACTIYRDSSFWRVKYKYNMV